MVALVLATVAALMPARASAQAPPEFRVILQLRTTLRDAVMACPAGGFGEGDVAAKARTLGSAVADAIGIKARRVRYDRDVDDECAQIDPDRPLTVAGSRSHERTLSIDTSRLFALADRERRGSLSAIVCTPSLPTNIRPHGARKSGDCEQWGFAFDSPATISIDFRATWFTLLKGLAASIAFWVLVWFIARRTRRLLDRKDRWRAFAGRLRVFAWAAVVVPALVVIAIWALIVQYITGFVPSLQLMFGVGVPGELTTSLAPSLALFIPAVAVPMGEAKRLRQQRPEPRDDSVPSNLAPLSVEIPAAARSTFAMMNSMTLAPLFFIAVLAETAFHQGVVVLLALVFVPIELVAAPLTRARLLAAYGAHDAGPLYLGRWKPSADAVGHQVDRALIVPVPTRLVGDRLGAVRHAGDALLVWERLKDVPPLLLAGGLLNAPPLEASVGAALALFAIAGSIRSTVERPVAPWSLFIIPGLLIFVRMVPALRARIVGRRRAARHPHASEILKGMLVIGRVEAQLQLMPVQHRAPGRVKRHRADLIWKSSVKRAKRFAKRSSIDQRRFEEILQEAREMDLA